MIYSTEDNLARVQDAITELVMGRRKVRVEYASPNGDKTVMQYTDVSLSELRQLERQMLNDLQPLLLMDSVDVEIVL